MHTVCLSSGYHQRRICSKRERGFKVSWVSFITGGMTVLLVYAMFSGAEVEEDEMELNQVDNELVINGSAGRNVILSCQTCRKLKKHKVIETNLFQCTKCKRHVDLRL